MITLFFGGTDLKEILKEVIMISSRNNKNE